MNRKHSHLSAAAFELVSDGLQSSVLAFKNAFWIMWSVVLLLAPLPFIMRRPSAEESASAAEAH